MGAASSLLRRLARDERGTSLIELSFIIPVLILLGVGASDLALCYAQGLKLQQAAARTMELAIASGTNNISSSALQTEASTASGVATGNITVDLWLECDGVRQGSFTGSCAGSSPSRFASVTITDTYNWMFEQIVPSWNNQPYSVPLKGYAEVRIQ